MQELENTPLPQAVLEHPLLQEEAWIAFRDEGITPLDQSELVTTYESRAEFLTGAWLLDSTTRRGLLNSLEPQMLRVSDMLTAGKKKNAIIEPRRSSKTTTLFCILLGRCYLRPIYFAGFTLLTTAKKTTERFMLDIYGPIVRQWPDENARPVKVIRSNGFQRVEFPNGSVLHALSPDGDAVRSGAYDMLLLDESGHASVERWEDVIGAVIPSFDTRPDGQLVLAGTAGKYRDGSVFWNYLNDPTKGRIRYTVPDDTDPMELEAWEPSPEHPDARVRELIERIHPGLHGLTTLETIAENFNDLTSEQFTLEYLGIFGAEGSNIRFIPASLWEEAAQDEEPTGKPKAFTLAFAVHPDGLYASVAYATLLPDGKTAVGLIYHQDGVQGFAQKVLGFARKHKVPVIYDVKSQGAAVEVELLKKAKPAPDFEPADFNAVKQGATKVMKGLRERTLIHYRDQPLDNAAEVAVKREMGMGGAWGFGRPKKNPEADITAIEAVSLALQYLREPKKKANLEFVFSDE